jgi:anaerobic selenocysteine-containing dehydrogenase
LESEVREQFTFCRICESLCGLKVTTKENEIISVEPDKQHVVTDGFSCVKGLYQHEMYRSPDRLERPLKKLPDGTYQSINWEQALSEIGQRVKQLLKAKGADSIGMYVGTAAGFSVLHPVFAQGFMTGLGSKSMYSSSTQDCSNKFAVSRLMYGFPFSLPFPDIENTNCLIVVGANPVISKWSFLQVPNPSKKLKDLEKRGGKLIIIDPRKTETAGIAGEHFFIRPGTDVFFYLSFLKLVIDKGGVNNAIVDRYCSGVEELVKLTTPWTAQRTASITGIAAETLDTIVQTYLDAKGAALYCSTGVNMGGNGTLAFWLQEVINAVTGNLDRKGGTLVGKGVIDFPKFGAKNGTLMRNDRSRIGDFGSVNDAFPGGLLADEILTPGDGQLRALFVTGGNPLITMANAGRLKKAFESLDLLVTLDIYQNETGSIADYVLPTTDPLQRADLPFIFPLMLGLQEKPYLQATEAIIPPRGEQRDEASIYLDLCRASGVNLFGSFIGQKFFELTMAYHSRRRRLKLPSLPQKGVLNGLLRLTRQNSFKQLLKSPHGILRNDHEEKSFINARILTSDKKIHLAPKELLEHAKKLEQDFESEYERLNSFKLITKRAVTTHNSWTHNIARMTEKGRDTNYAYLHPADMKELGVSDNTLIDIRSATAEIRIPVKSLDSLMRKVIAVPHGWGHQHATGLSHANQTKGVNVNILAADGPENLDRLSGMAHLTGIPVEIAPAENELQHSWSGV